MKRDYSLDFLRVLACILVIVIHVANVYCRAYADITSVNYSFAVVFNAIARISVPIFFMISGALLIKDSEFDLKKYLKRIWRLLLALIAWNLFYHIFNHYYLGNTTEFKDAFLESFFEPTKRHLWFMYAIIGIYMVLPFIQKMCTNLTKKEENLFLILFLFFGGVVYVARGVLVANEKMSSSANISYPIPLVQAAYYLAYFIIGHILYKRVQTETINKRWTKYLVIIPVISMVITVLYTLHLSDEWNIFYNYFFGYRGIFYILSSVSVFLLFVINKDKFKCNKLISSISGLTFGIYLIHPIFLDIIKQNIDIIAQPSYIYIPLYTLMIFINSYILSLIVKQIPGINRILG